MSVLERVVDPGAPSAHAPPESPLGPSALVDRIAARDRAIAALEAEQARDLAAFSDRRVAADQAAGVPDHLVGRTVGTELALALHIGQQSAANRAAQAWVIVRHHPRLLDLVGTGHVSMAGLRLVLRQTAELADDSRRMVDAQVAELATGEDLTPARLAQAAARFALAADPDAAARRAAAARARRRVWLAEPLDGVAGIGAELRAEEALACWTALDRTARAMRQHGDERSVQSLMADLVVERLTGSFMTRDLVAPDGMEDGSAVASAAVGADAPLVWRNIDGWAPWTATTAPPVQPEDCRLDPEPDDPVWDSVDWTLADTDTDTGTDSDTGTAPDRRPPPWRLPASVELQVVMSAETLLGIDDEPALLRGSDGQAAYGPIAAQVAREIADTAARRTLIALFADPVDGRLLAMDSSSRFFTGRLRDFCVWRDQVCRLGGGRIAEVDHRDEVQAQGPTSARNGQSVARLSHRIKDHPGITARVVDPGSAPASGPTAADDPGPWLGALRAAAPEVEWQMPTGHTYLSVPPPVLGPGARPDPLAWLDQRDEREAYRLFVAACEQTPLRTVGD
ncbi:MAG: hypothetical protein K0Q93_484 [Nocardioidaceae bacterium]|nr:hypothetical protein [Nocardioidaceae bacterium]